MANLYYGRNWSLTNNSPYFLLLALCLLLQTQFLPAVSGWSFNNYSPCTASCLIQAADQSGCPDDSKTYNSMAANACICPSATFWQSSAQCIGRACGTFTLNTVWQVGASNCGQSNTPIGVTEQQFFRYGNLQASSSPSLATPTTALTSSLSSEIPKIPPTSSHVSPVSSPTSELVDVLQKSTASLQTTFQTSATRNSLVSTPSQNSKPIDVNVVDGASFSRSDKIALGIGLGIGIPTLILTAIGAIHCIRR